LYDKWYLAAVLLLLSPDIKLFLFIVDESLKIGELERELLVTYDPAAIKEIVPKLASKVGNNQAVYLTDKVHATAFFYDFRFYLKQNTFLLFCIPTDSLFIS